jgi:hypothetical protein
MESDKLFKVLYTKDGQKKRKAYQDGSFSIKKNVNDSCVFTLIDEYGKDVKKVTEKLTKYKVATGSEFVFGAFEIQVEESCDDKNASVDSSLLQPQSGIASQKFQPPPKKLLSVAAQPNFLNAYPNHKSLSGTSSAPKKVAPQPDATLDPSVSKLMRPHQIEGANFLLKRLIDGDISTNENSNLTNQNDKCNGAILADEVLLLFILQIMSH